MWTLGSPRPMARFELNPGLVCIYVNVYIYIYVSPWLNTAGPWECAAGCVGKPGLVSEVAGRVGSRTQF